MKQKIFFPALVIAFLIFCLAPSVTSAASVPEHTVTQLTKDTFLLTLKYPFSFLGYEARMPMRAVRGVDYNELSPYLGYDLFNEDGTPLVGGKTSALVLSDAPISGSTYQVSAGKQADFMLVALVTLPNQTSSDVSEHSRVYLGVTKLPFTLVKSGKELPSQLDQKQLESYKTDSVER